MAGGMIRGVVGQIKWSYHVAATFNGYTVTRSATNEWTLSGTIVRSPAPNLFQLGQRPLFFVAPHAKGEWRWLVETWNIDANHFRATLGPPL